MDPTPTTGPRGSTAERRAERAAVVLVLLLLVVRCAGLDTFEVNESADSTIQGATILENLVGDIGFSGFLDMDIAQSTELQNQGVERHQIDAVHVTALSLTITDPPSGQDFTFLDSLEFYVEAPSVSRQRIAFGGPFAAGAARIELQLDDIDLAPYAAAPSMSITTEATGRRPSQTVTISAAMTLLVDVNVGGALCGG